MTVIEYLNFNSIKLITASSLTFSSQIFGYLAAFVFIFCFVSFCLVEVCGHGLCVQMVLAHQNLVSVGRYLRWWRRMEKKIPNFHFITLPLHKQIFQFLYNIIYVIRLLLLRNFNLYSTRKVFGLTHTLTLTLGRVLVFAYRWLCRPLTR